MCEMWVLSLNAVKPHKVFIGIGSNSDRENNILLAIRALQDAFGELLLSSLYEAEAMGSDEAENYYNLVAGFETHKSPAAINQILKRIEKLAGPRIRRQCPLDIDLLLYEDRIFQDDGLSLPHQNILEFAYVAVPLAEIHGSAVHPETGMSYTEHSRAEHLHGQKIRKITLRKTHDH